MEKIKWRKVKLKELQKLDTKASRSCIYINEKLLYKIFNKMPPKMYDNKARKIEIFSQIKEEYLITAESIIMNRKYIKGYVSKYIKDTITLRDLKEYATFETFLSVVMNISKDLQKFHHLEGKPIMSDVNFYNFIIDKNLKHYFVDHDSYTIYDIEPDEISHSLYCYRNYLYDYTGIWHNVNQLTDKISFILEFFCLLLQYEVPNVTIDMYEKASDVYPVLNQLKEIFLQLKQIQDTLPDIPYFHEIITEVGHNRQPNLLLKKL